MLRIGINGFGRIGRAIFRINAKYPRFRVVAINDLDPNLENHAYLLKYDSIYGRFHGIVETDLERKRLKVDDKDIAFFSEPRVQDVPWQEHGVDIVIEASGVKENVLAGRELIRSGVRKMIVTHAPSEGVDKTIIFGVNENQYQDAQHQVIAASICDANAIAPILKVVHENFGVTGGFITTLHPWLPYQNLTDGSVRSISNPGHFWTDFALGRASTMSLIPKQTTAMKAVRQVLPEVGKCIEAISYRVPTAIVSSSDVTLMLDKKVTANEVNAVMEKTQKQHGRVFGYSTEDLVSIDHLAIEQSVVVDSRWTTVTSGGLCKLVLWYDNEWGFSNRVVDMVSLIEEHQAKVPANNEKSISSRLRRSVVRHSGRVPDHVD
ncbi:aldehyde dehydrogenase [bacterium]|nr:MAG: aldehyde dehydrogenase [bacterium]